MSRTQRSAPVPAGTRPVASIAVDLPLLHLDRPFDYLVPEHLDAQAVPGVRVKVKLAGQRLDGFLLQRSDASTHEGRLSFLDGVVSAEPVLTPNVFGLARDVADRYIGTVADVLRLAVPPRHARVEAEQWPPDAGTAGAPSSDAPWWSEIGGGPALLERLASGSAPRAVVDVPPGVPWAGLVAQAVVATRRSGKGCLVLVPDHQDAAAVVDAVASAGVAVADVVHLAADAGPAERYRRFLRVLRGRSRVVIGSRAAAFAPVHDLGLVVLWDDGDDLHAEPRAPYPHSREVACLRAVREDAAVLLLGHARSCEGQRLVRSGWAVPLSAARERIRSAAPTVRGAVDDHEQARDPMARAARIPSAVLRTLREALASGPVLVQVPRGGYVPVLRCQECRTPARCTRCAGPLSLESADRPPRCGRCARVHHGWTCSECGASELRAGRVGLRRTAEELGRAFGGVEVLASGGDTVLRTIPDAPALVIATPGAEPTAPHGYAAIALLDGDLLLDRPDLRSGEEALRRWLNAASLARPADAAVVIVADPSARPVQALIRWDPAGFAAQEFDDRAAAHLPPAARVVALTGAPAAVMQLADAIEAPEGTERLGPAPWTPTPRDDESVAVRLVLRAPLARGAELSAAVRAAATVRSARKEPDFVNVRVDPLDLA